MTLIPPSDLTSRYVSPGLYAPTIISAVYDPDMVEIIADTFGLRYIKINGCLVKSIFIGATEISLIEFDKV